MIKLLEGFSLRLPPRTLRMVLLKQQEQPQEPRTGLESTGDAAAQGSKPAGTSRLLCIPPR